MNLWGARTLNTASLVRETNPHYITHNAPAVASFLTRRDEPAASFAQIHKPCGWTGLRPPRGERGSIQMVYASAEPRRRSTVQPRFIFGLKETHKMVARRARANK